MLYITTEKWFTEIHPLLIPTDHMWIDGFKEG